MPMDSLLTPTGNPTRVRLRSTASTKAPATELKDSSGNNHHGKIVGAKWVPATVDRRVAFPTTGFAMEFDGQTTFIEFPTFQPDFSQPFTFEAVVEPHPEPRQPVAGAGIWPSVGKVFSFVNRDNANYWMAFNHVGGGWAVRYRTPVSDLMTYTRRDKLHGVRHHIAGVWTGEKFNWFVDGQLSNGFDEAKLPDPSHGVGNNGVASMGLEKNLEGKTSRHFRGTLDEVRISRGARYLINYTPTSRLEPDANTLALYHFDEGQGDVLNDSSGNNHHGKIVGAKWVKTEPASAAVTVQQRTEGGYEVTAPGYRLKIAATGLIESVESGTTKLLESTAFGTMGTIATRKTTVAQAAATLTFTEGDDYRLIYEFNPQGFVIKAKVSQAAAQRDGIDGKSYYLIHLTRFATSANRVRPLDGTPAFDLPAKEVYMNRFVVDFKDGTQVEVTSAPAEHSAFLFPGGPYAWGRPQNPLDADNEIRYEIRPPGQAVGWHGWPADAPPPAIAPFDAAQAKEHQEAWAKYLGVPVEYTNSIGMKFVLIPPGEFTMGSTPEEIEAALDDRRATKALAGTASRAKLRSTR